VLPTWATMSMISAQWVLLAGRLQSLTLIQLFDRPHAWYSRTQAVMELLGNFVILWSTIDDG
jgi:hypothetical protein